MSKLFEEKYRETSAKKLPASDEMQYSPCNSGGVRRTREGDEIPDKGQNPKG
jgi:hypothetical protein